MEIGKNLVLSLGLFMAVTGSIQTTAHAASLNVDGEVNPFGLGELRQVEYLRGWNDALIAEEEKEAERTATSHRSGFTGNLVEDKKYVPPEFDQTFYSEIRTLYEKSGKKAEYTILQPAQGEQQDSFIKGKTQLRILKSAQNIIEREINLLDRYSGNFEDFGKNNVTEELERFLDYWIFREKEFKDSFDNYNSNFEPQIAEVKKRIEDLKTTSRGCCGFRNKFDPAYRKANLELQKLFKALFDPWKKQVIHVIATSPGVGFYLGTLIDYSECYSYHHQD